MVRSSKINNPASIFRTSAPPLHIIEVTMGEPTSQPQSNQSPAIKKDHARKGKTQRGKDYQDDQDVEVELGESKLGGGRGVRSSATRSTAVSNNKQQIALANPTTPPKTSTTRGSLDESPGLKTVGSDTTSGTQTLTINHSVNRSAGGQIMGMSKPMFGLVSVLLMATTGASLWGWLQIPGLNEQIKELEEQVDRLTLQVDRLETQVDRLEVENNRYASLNNQLNETVGEFRELNEELNATATRLDRSVHRLNASVADLEEINDSLAAENKQFANLNRQLNETSVDLGIKVDRLESSLVELILQKNALSNLTTELSRELGLLSDNNENLNDTVILLNSSLNELFGRIDRLESVNEDLQIVVSFLNETADTIAANTVEQVAAFLSDQIVAQRALVLLNLENTYLQRINFWDCSFRDIFRLQGFVRNEDAPISTNNDGTQDLSDVLDYVDDRVLSRLCLDPTDFERFLRSQYGNGLVFFTANELYQGVTLYTGAAMNYYFPQTGDVGSITQEQWADSNYRCDTLPTFQYDASIA